LEIEPTYLITPKQRISLFALGSSPIRQQLLRKARQLLCANAKDDQWQSNNDACSLCIPQFPTVGLGPLSSWPLAIPRRFPALLKGPLDMLLSSSDLQPQYPKQHLQKTHCAGMAVSPVVMPLQ
jgi:hypothetical protein